MLPLFGLFRVELLRLCATFSSTRMCLKNVTQTRIYEKENILQRLAFLLGSTCQEKGFLRFHLRNQKLQNTPALHHITALPTKTE